LEWFTNRSFLFFIGSGGLPKNSKTQRFVSTNLYTFYYYERFLTVLFLLFLGRWASEKGKREPLRFISIYYESSVLFFNVKEQLLTVLFPLFLGSVAEKRKDLI
jgi:hypothetical protein